MTSMKKQCPNTGKNPSKKNQQKMITEGPGQLDKSVGHSFYPYYISTTINLINPIQSPTSDSPTPPGISNPYRPVQFKTICMCGRILNVKC